MTGSDISCTGSTARLSTATSSGASSRPALDVATRGPTKAVRIIGRTRLPEPSGYRKPVESVVVRKSRVREASRASFADFCSTALSTTKGDSSVLEVICVSRRCTGTEPRGIAALIELQCASEAHLVVDRDGERSSAGDARSAHGGCGIVVAGQRPIEPRLPAFRRGVRFGDVRARRQYQRCCAVRRSALGERWRDDHHRAAKEQGNELCPTYFRLEPQHLELVLFCV